MPTYEYLCQSCGARFEAWQKMTDDPIETCPTCSGHVRRVLYPAGILFKGSGFYSTDHRSASMSNGHSTNGTSKNTSTSDGTGTGESKAPAETTAASKPKSTANTTTGD